jgi:pSer/pThr/pTyr-binding forkhead associated (FHA) protein
LPIAEVSGIAAVPSSRRGEVLVEGVECPSGHFNHPAAKFCVRCGMPMPKTPHRVSRPRPPLGVLVTDDGAVFPVTGDYVIGRSPERDDAVVSGTAQPLSLSDPDHSVSRVHAYLKIAGWRVLLTDGASSNGTFVSHSSPSGPWARVGVDTATALAPGDRLRIGSRQLLFDSYHGEPATNARH